jgi:peptide/nickel transport system permease protein
MAMIRFLFRRFVTMAVTLLVISALVFVIIKLPPGDFLTNQIAELRAQGEAASAQRAEFLIKQYGLDRPVWEQYLIWLGAWPTPDGGFSGLLQGNWGWSFEFDKPVGEVIGDALWLTLLVNLVVVVFVHVVAIPIAIYSATRQYSIGDYVATFIGYIGLATPSFLLALILLYYSNRWFGVSIGGLYAPEFAGQPWTGEKIRSLLAHLVVPTLVIGLAGTAAMIRRMRANLLDELGKQYYTTAKAKGLPPTRALLKYPFRMSLNPFIADIGNLLPNLVSGSVLVSLVLSLPTVGPILLQSLRSQDQFLAGFILMFVAILTVIGMLISDLLLAALDPRIRMGGAR